MDQGGHLFVINGDLNTIDCDAVLVPVDRGMNVTTAWLGLVGERPGGRITGVRFSRGKRVVRMPPARGADAPPEVWLGEIGKVDVEDDWYAGGLVEFVETASGGPIGGQRRRRRLAVNVAGSGHGGGSRKKGSLYRTIVPQLQEAAEHWNVDVVLVCWGSKSYSAAQQARLQTNVPASADPALSDVHRLKPAGDVITSLAERARRGDLVLFIGAGVSMSAGVASWQGLLDRLLANSGAAAAVDRDRLRKLDVRDQAAIIHDLYTTEADGAARFQAELQAAVSTSARYSLTHGLLASLGTRENVTTNYDTLFETAMGTPGRDCAVLPYEQARADGTWLLKLHGSVDQPADLVLTRDDYLNLPSRSGALFGVLQTMLMTKHILFVGYSLTDDSFHRVMHEVRQVLKTRRGEKLGTALVLFDDPLLDRLWGNELDIVPMVDRVQPEETTPADFAEPVHRLERFLDRVALAAADVSAFLLDETYDDMLSGAERDLRNKLLDARKLAATGNSPIDGRVTRALAAFDVHEAGV